MNKPQILFVEDDTAVGNLIATTLETQNYQFHRAKNGQQAILEALSCRPDVMLLDLGLPDMDGIEIIKKIRSWSNMPIIVVSARSDDRDKVTALDAGADDYLTKPVNFEELLLRVEALLRRCGIQRSGEIAVGGCTLHADTLLVTGDGYSYELRPREFALLQTLLAAPTKIFTRQMLMDELWGYDSESDPRTVDTHIRRLREKLAGVPDFEIQTVRGLGYRAVIR